MRNMVYVSFNAGSDKYEQVLTLLKRIDCDKWLADESSFLGALFGHSFDADDPKLAALRSLLQEHGIRWNERIDRIYTDAELASFALLALRATRLQEEGGGPRYGTSYDLSAACAACGTGAIQTTELFLPLRGFPRKGAFCEAAGGELLVGSKLADALRAASLSGLELRQARFYGNGEPLPWWQLISSHEMPPMSKQSRGIVRGDPEPCPLCERDSYFDTVREPAEYAYDSSIVRLQDLPDVVHTWEHFGKSRRDTECPERSRFAPALLLVRPSVFTIFRKCKESGVRFTPVRIL